MREILFRGKRVDNGEWVEGPTIVVIHQDDNDLIFMPQYGEDVKADPMEGNDRVLTSMYGNYYQILPQTVGQYTGLTDKNGRKIFEGDIIHLEYSQVFFGGEYFGEYTAEVSYKEGCFITDGRNNGDEIETPLSGFDNDEVEILGNIHDNPELLEGTDECPLSKEVSE